MRDVVDVDMGATGINDRLEQIRPKLIFADNAALYNGKIISQMDKLQTIVKTLHSELLLHVIIIPRIASQPTLLDGFEKSITWKDFLKNSTDEPLHFEQVEFNHPAVIVYSSGTTGKPKCIVHSHGVSIYVTRLISGIPHTNEERAYVPW
jgi:acetoacetyl-CoA synthetase